MPAVDYTVVHASTIDGAKLSLTDKSALASRNIRLTPDAVQAVVTVADESANARAITIQLKDANGVNITKAETVEVFVFADAAGLDITATGGSTGIAIGASGKILTTVTAKKRFTCRTTAAGLLALTYTDTGTDVAFLGVQLPNGTLVFGSQALTCAS
jgi:hypothetical protein